MVQQKLDLDLRGLYTSPNNLSGVPPGAFEVADNLVINTKSLVESRRGQTQYLDPFGSALDKLFNYKSTLIANAGNRLAYSDGTNWNAFTGTFLPPNDSVKIRSLEAMQNFYFTTSLGVYKLDALTNDPAPSGEVKALGATGVTTGSSGFLVNNSAVAYRTVWGYTDANSNLILGAPSPRLVVENNTGGSRDVQLTILIPDGITTDHFYQVYRSFGTLNYTDEPADELQLVAQAFPTSGQIASKSLTLTDDTPYSLMRTALYTNPSQEGIANENDQPPFCLDMDVFKTCAFYANTTQRQSLIITMIGVNWPSLSYHLEATAHTHSNTIIDNITTANIRVGMNVSSAGVALGSITVVSINSSSQVTVSGNMPTTSTVSVLFEDVVTIGSDKYFASSTNDPTTNRFQVVSTGTPGSNINDTAINFVTIINTSTTNSTVYAFYLSGTNDLPGQILLQERAIGGSTFLVNSSSPASFSPALNNLSSSNDARQNRVSVSKEGQVESVPAYRFFDIGSANFPIQRVVALRDGIFFFKQDGIFRLSGETFESFTVALLDNTVVLQVPESAVAFNNQVFCYTTQAICAITDSGVRIMSVPIETDLLELSSAQYVNFTSASFGVAYESARQYMFFTVSDVTDTYATQGFIYNSLTDSWTRWPMNRTCGVVNPGVNKLFMGDAVLTGQALIERKSYTNADFADLQYTVSIFLVYSETKINVDDARGLQVGWTLTQGTRQTIITAINAKDISVEPIKGLVPGDAIGYQPILNALRWSPIDADNPGLLKQFSEISLFFRNAAFSQIKDIQFATNIIATGDKVPVINNSFPEAWGQFQWGDAPWGGQLGGQAVLRTYVPRASQRGNWLTLSLEINEAFTGFSLQGVSIIYNVMSTRLR